MANIWARGRSDTALALGAPAGFGAGLSLVVRAEPAEKTDLLSLRGVLKPKVRGVTVEEMNETIRRAAGGA